MHHQAVASIWVLVTYSLGITAQLPPSPVPPTSTPSGTPSHSASSSDAHSSSLESATTTIMYHHYHDPPDTASTAATATTTTIRHRHQFFHLRHNHHLESVEDQAAVLAEMRHECEVKMKNERQGMRVGRTGALVKSPTTTTTTIPHTGTFRASSSTNTNTNTALNDPLQPPGSVKWEENEELAEGDEAEIENFDRVLENVKENESWDGHCPTTFDNIYCWPKTAPNTIVAIPCPSYVKNFMRGSEATRYCTSQGTWFSLEGNNKSWTNYSQCSATLVVPIVVNSTLEMWVPVVRVVSLIGYSVSLATLLVAFSVLACIKHLRCPRNTLHMHLFLSFICRAVGALARNNDISGVTPQQPHSDGGTWGCRLFTSLWQYFILANYSWILMEGLYLHNLIFLALFTDNSAITLYIVLGWGLPLILVVGWAVARMTAENTLCWFTNAKPWLFWTFIRGPVGVSILVSFALFLNIARELLLKLKSSTAPETRRCRYRRWARSTLVLVPLFGVHYAALLGFTYFMGKNSTIEIIWLFTDQLFASFQGFFVATLYCLLNAEVRSELHKIWQHWQMNNKSDKSLNFHSALSHSRTYFSSRGTGAPWMCATSGRRKECGVEASKTPDEVGMSVLEKTNGSPAQATCLSVLDDTQNQVSFTTSLAVVELQPPPDSTSVTSPLQEATVLCNHQTPPEGGDKACVLLLQPLSSVNHGPADHEDQGMKTHLDDQECDSVLDIPPPSTIIYDAGDSCEGSPLLPQGASPSLPALTESTF
ncbi:secretin receptor-like isoform X1 [Portunus trituberculatus]|uniref:secretin receptor-like isoform X1 n=1 Tax=Portunus trituberculatus TaxID=210409 RepID=UPI001E1CC937|nr:secretin receptor-like isoform X1 [Portunus trituberculatus]XP_045118832.1 secretin receptor-like isoform X1 [Portunus trituberculatus]